MFKLFVGFIYCLYYVILIFEFPVCVFGFYVFYDFSNFLENFSYGSVLTSEKFIFVVTLMMYSFGYTTLGQHQCIFNYRNLNNKSFIFYNFYVLVKVNFLDFNLFLKFIFHNSKSLF